MLYAGKEYRDFKDRIEWELDIDDVVIVLLKTESISGNHINCIGFDAMTRVVRWELGGQRTGGAYDAVVGFHVSLHDRAVYAFLYS